MGRVINKAVFEGAEKNDHYDHRGDEGESQFHEALQRPAEATLIHPHPRQRGGAHGFHSKQRR